MCCLTSLFDFDASVKETGDRSFGSVQAILCDKTSRLIHEIEFSTKSSSSFLSHLMPVAKYIACEWVSIVVRASPSHYFVFKLLVLHVDVCIEGITIIEPLNVMPYIWLCAMRDCDNNFASRHDIIDIIGSWSVFAFEIFFSIYWNCALTVDDNWLGISTDRRIIIGRSSS